MPSLLSLLAPLWALAADSASATAPTLRLEKVVSLPASQAVDFNFEFRNPGSEVLYLDFQGQPGIALKGRTLFLTFGGSQTAEENPETQRPARVGPRQVFTGARRIGKVPSAFKALQVEMVFYPERREGEGRPFLWERPGSALSQPEPAGRKAAAPNSRPAPAGAP